MPMLTTVLVMGTFDLLHAGHRQFFAQAAQLGTVTAIVARDASVHRIKGFLPEHGERSRVARVARDPRISRALLGHPSDFLAPVMRICPDIIALGYDQQTFSIPDLKAKLKARGLTPRIIRLKSFQPGTLKSSFFRKDKS